MKPLPVRSEVPPEHRWDVSQVFATEAAWEQALQGIAARIPALASYEGRLAEGPGVLLAALRLRDELLAAADRVLQYAHCRRDEDTTDPHGQALWQRAVAATAQVGAAAAFITPEILRIPDDVLEGFLAREPALGTYRYHLEEIRRVREHTLSPAEEALLSRFGPLLSAPSTLHRILLDGEAPYPTVPDDRGEPVRVTQPRLLRLLRSHDRAVRERAYHAYMETVAQFRHTLAANLETSVRGAAIIAAARRYASTLQAALFPEAIPEEVYHNLIRTVRSGLAHFHRYNQLKARILGLPRLEVWDLQVPPVPDDAHPIPYEAACRLTLDSLAPLGAEYQGRVQEGLRRRWVDVYENRGKASGGYCTGAYRSPPLILMNYQDDFPSLRTLTHELGHAMHHVLRDEVQPPVYASSPALVLEVPSTAHEILLTEHLLARGGSRDWQVLVLSQACESIAGLLFRQVQFAEFELAVHRQVQGGGALTADFLAGTYGDLYAEYLGPAVHLHPIARHFWAAVPHFYVNFYVYKYALGVAGAAALMQPVLRGDPAGRDAFLDLLRAGSSDTGMALLGRAGVDLLRPAAVEAVIALFGSYVERLERLV